MPGEGEEGRDAGSKKRGLLLFWEGVWVGIHLISPEIDFIPLI